MELPTTVRTNTGLTYTIAPPGPWGSFAWVRYASQIAIAYAQVENNSEEAKWQAEYQRRAAIWNALEAGKDRAEVLKQFGADLLTAPFRIAADIGTEALDLAKEAKDTAFKLADILSSPLFWVAAAVLVAAVAFSPVGGAIVRKLR